jgi:hypothetical protein
MNKRACRKSMVQDANVIKEFMKLARGGFQTNFIGISLLKILDYLA